ncbi:Flagellar FliJ protein [Buchnera aphidicola (Cinara kochiana kochiana)]|uniref:Flagellar FliJ protein n=2 Tax=Buchnera aphidicola TaxID=9 RepID=A0A451D553_9GAMM|nr:Flagellar FliJ protein [Buchnera aphidicola (Cinara kochiana kochiana)]
MILNVSRIRVIKKKIEIDIKKNIYHITYYKNKQIKVQQYLFQLKKYKNKYNFLLHKNFFNGISPHIIQLFMNFILMLQKFIMQQNVWLDYFKKKLKKRLLVQNKLYSKLEQWKKLELRMKNCILRKNILMDQREDNVVCLNNYNILYINK